VEKKKHRQEHGCANTVTSMPNNLTAVARLKFLPRKFQKQCFIYIEFILMQNKILREIFTEESNAPAEHHGRNLWLKLL